MTTEALVNRYASDWNTYSAAWDQHYGDRYRHLGDEWCDDGTAARTRDARILATTAEPWLYPAARVLEIGPGGGKWTVRLARQVREVVAFDVADAMLARTRARCASEGLDNVSFVLGDGQGMSAVADGSIDIVFSYDVFVHIALEDTVAYAAEIARILRSGGVAIVHHAVNDAAPAWDRIESHNDWYRDRGNTLGQYYYHSMEALRRMYERAGLAVVGTLTEYCTVVFTVQKQGDSMATRIERAIREAAIAATPEALAHAVADLTGTVEEMQTRLASLAADLGRTAPGAARYAALQKVRRLLRG
jgi:ubiquinone/menaquinone biosynthesis C-methylase UbiE